MNKIYPGSQLLYGSPDQCHNLYIYMSKNVSGMSSKKACCSTSHPSQKPKKCVYQIRACMYLGFCIPGRGDAASRGGGIVG